MFIVLIAFAVVAHGVGSGVFSGADTNEWGCDFIRSQCVPPSECAAMGGRSAPGLCGDDAPLGHECCYTDYDPDTERDPLVARCYTPEQFVFDCGHAFEDGIDLGDTLCVCIDNRPVSLQAARAFQAMRKHASVPIEINSGFRVMSEQEYFYRCYQIKEHFGVIACNDGNLAARPGYSNHQNGIALDIDTDAYEWLVANAHNYFFVRTVDTERWHWELRPQAPTCDAFVDYPCQDRSKCGPIRNDFGSCVDESLCKIPVVSTNASLCPLDPGHLACCEEFADLTGKPKLV